MSLRCCYSKSSASVVIIGVNFDTLEKKFLKDENVAFLCRVKTAELIIGYCHLRQNVKLALFFSLFCAVTQQVLNYGRIFSVVKWRSTPSVSWTNVNARFNQEFYNVKMPSSCCQMQRCSSVIISSVQILTLCVQSLNSF